MLRKIGKGFITDIHSDFFKKLMQAFSIIVTVFYCFLKIIAANAIRPKAATPIRPNQRKPFCIASDRGLTEPSRKQKQKKDREKHLKRRYHFLFDSEDIKTSVFAY